jgi:fructose-1,6-bisphosphatase I / sedoheptulose-1,7-bisphosphatase
MHNQLTLKDFLAEELKHAAQGHQLATLLLEIASTCTKIAALTTKGALLDIMAKLDSQNIQGETQTKLDVVTNDLFINALSRCELVAGFASEELDEVTSIRAANYLVIFDPLDGSSNAPVNVSVGTIFSVLNAPEDRVPTEADYLQAGNHQVAAGYALYGPSTMLVFSIGKGTHGFTLDPDKQDFILTHPNMRVAELSSEFAINASNERFWEPPVVRYVAECKEGATGIRERDFNMRWVASMVADIHRILMRGGVYLYPKDNKKPIKAGRLRLMYEVNPMSMLVEQAGGKSSTGRARVLDILPEHIHQRVPVVIGTAQEVALVERYTKAYDMGGEQEDILQLFGERSLFHKKQ